LIHFGALGNQTVQRSKAHAMVSNWTISLILLHLLRTTCCTDEEQTSLPFD